MVRHERVCKYCKDKFTPRSTNPMQRTCPAPECQARRKKANQRAWRKRHPYYGKYDPNGSFAEWHRNRSKEWRKNNRQRKKEYDRKYRLKNKQWYRNYMRIYMRLYREGIVRRYKNYIDADEN